MELKIMYEVIVYYNKGYNNHNESECIYQGMSEEKAYQTYYDTPNAVLNAYKETNEDGQKGWNLIDSIEN